MTEKIEREKLYEQVWTTPLTILCRSYGLSYPGLRKLCSELNVPTPERGHWAKVAAGGRVKKPALPPLDSSSAVLPVNTGKRLRATKLKKRTPPAATKQKTADSRDASFHPLLRPLSEKYLQAEKVALQEKEQFERAQTHPGKSADKLAQSAYPGNWQRFCEKGQILCDTQYFSILRVSLQSVRRALKLLNRLIEHLEASGFRLQITERDESLEAIRNGAKVNIRIKEKTAQTYVMGMTFWSKTPERIRTFSPTGRLFIYVEQQGGGKADISDRPDNPLEKHWEKIVSVIEQQHVKSIEQLATWAARERETKEAETRWIEVVRLREETQRGEEAEALKRQALLQEAKDWQSAETLRTYLDALERRIESGGIPSADYTEWKAWARGVAEDLDKSRLRISEAPAALDSILGRKDSN
jgi:hypothetical protein